MTWHYFVAGLLPLLIGYKNIRKKQIMRNHLQFWRYENLQIHFPSMLARICRTRHILDMPEKVKSLGHTEMLFIEYYFIRRTSDGKWEGRLSQESWNRRREYAQIMYDEAKERSESSRNDEINPELQRLTDELENFYIDATIKKNIHWHSLEDISPFVSSIETAYQKYVHTPDVHPVSFYWHEYNENWYLWNIYFNKKKDSWSKSKKLIFYYVSNKIKSYNQHGILYQMILS